MSHDANRRHAAKLHFHTRGRADALHGLLVAGLVPADRAMEAAERLALDAEDMTAARLRAEDCAT